MGHPNTEREIVLANISMALSLLGIRVVTTRRWQHADKSGHTNHETTARLGFVARETNIYRYEARTIE